MVRLCFGWRNELKSYGTIMWFTTKEKVKKKRRLFLQIVVVLTVIFYMNDGFKNRHNCIRYSVNYGRFFKITIIYLWYKMAVSNRLNLQ